MLTQLKSKSEATPSPSGEGWGEANYSSKASSLNPIK